MESSETGTQVPLFTARETEAQAGDITQRGVAIQDHLPRMHRGSLVINNQAFTLEVTLERREAEGQVWRL